MDAGEHQSFGDLLRGYRLAAGLSQEELAERADLGRRTISDLERGVAAAPYRHTVARLADALALAERERAKLTGAVRRSRAARPSSPQRDYPLLETKLVVPPVRASLVPRPRLIEQLAAGLRGALTLLSAPAGSGKTTLLSAWHAGPQGQRLPLAWVSLDADDNDPARFWRYVLTALDRAVPGVVAPALALLGAVPTPPAEAVPTALLNGLRAAPRDVVLALEDYHVIAAEPIHRALAFLLERRPDTLHLLIATRTDPPLPLARLRARGEVVELRAADLRFTVDEATTFFDDVMGVPLTAEHIALLAARTEGWIAGLQLAALSLRGREDAHGFVAAFSGSHRHVRDYLTEEVLDRRPEHVREFLFATSILGRLTGPLCDAVTGRDDGQAMLERLEEENLFIVALDEERRWYRYHHLFGEALRACLERERPARVNDLHRRAAAWYERAGWAGEAIGHALAAEDYEHAADLVERVVGETWARSEMLTLLRWLEALPDNALRDRPRLLLEHATALMVMGRPDGAEPLVRQAERAVGCDGDGAGDDPGADGDESRRPVLGYAAAVRSWRANVLGDTRSAIALARRALALLPAQDLRPRTMATLSIAAAYREVDDPTAACAAFAEAGELAWAAGNLYAAAVAEFGHAELQMARGRLHEAAGILRRALRRAAERGGAGLLATGEVHMAMGALLYERDELDAATRWLTEGVDLAGQTSRSGTVVDGSIAISRIRFARGEVAGAIGAAREAERWAHGAAVPDAVVKAAAWQAHLYLAIGDLDAATVAQERAEGAGAIWVAARELERVTQARLLLARGERDEALRLLQALRAAAEATGRWGSVIRLLALEALALQAQGATPEAVRTLARALSLAEPEGYVRTFADEGPPMAALLAVVRDAQDTGQLDASGHVPARYLRRLLAAVDQRSMMPHTVLRS